MTLQPASDSETPATPAVAGEVAHESGWLDTDELTALYIRGRTMREISNQTEVSYDVVRSRLLAAGVKLRRQGPRKVSVREGWTSAPVRWQKILSESLEQTGAAGVLITVTEYLGRPPTRSEVTAARRAAHALDAAGIAKVVHRAARPGSGRTNLYLTTLGRDRPSGSGELTDIADLLVEAQGMLARTSTSIDTRHLAALLAKTVSETGRLIGNREDERPKLTTPS